MVRLVFLWFVLLQSGISAFAGKNCSRGNFNAATSPSFANDTSSSSNDTLCAPCHSLCEDCFDITENDCFACVNLFISSGTTRQGKTVVNCLDECPDGYGAGANSSECVVLSFLEMPREELGQGEIAGLTVGMLAAFVLLLGGLLTLRVLYTKYKERRQGKVDFEEYIDHGVDAIGQSLIVGSVVSSTPGLALAEEKQSLKAETQFTRRESLSDTLTRRFAAQQSDKPEKKQKESEFAGYIATNRVALENEQKMQVMDDYNSNPSLVKPEDDYIKMGQVKPEDDYIKMGQVKPEDDYIKMGQVKREDDYIKMGQVKPEDDYIKMGQVKPEDDYIKMGQVKPEDDYIKMGQVKPEDDYIKMGQVKPEDDYIKMGQVKPEDDYIKMGQVKPEDDYIKMAGVGGVCSSVELQGNSSIDVSCGVGSSFQENNTLKMGVKGMAGSSDHQLVHERISYISTTSENRYERPVSVLRPHSSTYGGYESVGQQSFEDGYEKIRHRSSGSDSLYWYASTDKLTRTSRTPTMDSTYAAIKPKHVYEPTPGFRDQPDEPHTYYNTHTN